MMSLTSISPRFSRSPVYGTEFSLCYRECSLNSRFYRFRGSSDYIIANGVAQGARGLLILSSKPSR
jgi:hypothetical protein